MLSDSPLLRMTIDAAETHDHVGRERALSAAARNPKLHNEQAASLD